MDLSTTSFVAVSAAALLAAGLTLYSGFGLGTLLLPVFALFFPVEIAIVATALVHGANNVFKVLLLGRGADRGVVLYFGVPAVLAALAGALALGWLVSADSRLTVGTDVGPVAQVTPVKLMVGFLMVVFAVFELLPRFRRLAFDRRYLPLGGVLSGFFGGLTGHQGALRSAFLAKAGLDTPAFVGSNAVIGFLVDLTRIGVYAALFSAAGAGLSGFTGWPLVATGAASAFAGVLIGKRYLHKVTMRSVQLLVGSFLLAAGVALMLGLI
ncbi:TSUP family transporter [Elongatibacter sediminis]|uniref:Probable membrane transporter protein n=1 Tax=Elongatibacter sediminis TaxID=3119006 RepID=A0AAW9R5P3_9GAMM